jgi:hypothetical protein
MEGISSISGILEKLAAIKLRRAGEAPAPHAAADDSPISVVLGHVGVHEFLGLDDGPSGSDWAPPLTMLAWLAAKSMTASLGECAGQAANAAGQAVSQVSAAGSWVGTARSSSVIAWVGRRSWPSLYTLLECGGPELLAASLFIRCGGTAREDAAIRLWAAELAVRSGACTMVVADASSFSRVATQRLLLGSAAAGCVCVLARPAREARTLSAATTRWRVRRAYADELAGGGSALVPGSMPGSISGQMPGSLPTVSSFDLSRAAGWTAQLLRCKGMQPASALHGASDERHAWLLRTFHHVGGYTSILGAPASGTPDRFDLLPILVHGSVPATPVAPTTRLAAG